MSRLVMAQLLRAAALTAGLLACAGAAPADSPAQVRQAIQAVCDRTAAAYARRDLPGLMAQYARDYKGTNVTGRSTNYLEAQAGLAREAADQARTGSGSCTVGAVTLSGGRAQAVLTWHYRNRHGGAIPYTYVRDYTEQSLWSRAGGGWRQVRGRMTRDTITYQK